MTSRCSACARILVDLRKPHVLNRALLIYGALVRVFGGRVDLQKHLLAYVYARYGITNGCAHAHIEAMAERGALRIEYWGPGMRRKRITAVRPPELPGPKHQPGPFEAHAAEGNALALPQRHRARIERWLTASGRRPASRRGTSRGPRR